MEYIMSFLMGLNDSYSHARGQILLVDPLPSINRVFSLVSQEHQRNMSSSSSLTMFVKNGGSRHGKSSANSDSNNGNKFPSKNRPFFAHTAIFMGTQLKNATRSMATRLVLDKERRVIHLLQQHQLARFLHLAIIVMMNLA
ncbi:hypothetical protein Sjap_006594 [Stephania japonica]|uniref:Uncharacterized protein n=1 Tax=Stephania japonica TaxID=461633 RepID=A0AAP0K696_9MAGN